MIFARIATLLSLLVPAVSAQDSRQGLGDRLMPLITGHDGEVACYVKSLKTGERFTYRASEVMGTASLCKVAAMVAAYRGADASTVDLSQKIELRKEDMVPGSGILTQHFSAGATISLRDAVRLMIVYSDNTATNLVVNAVGLKTTSDEMTALGLAETKIHSQVFRRDTSVFPKRSKKYGLGSTTAFEMGRLLEQLHRNECASAEACAAMIEHLSKCNDDSKIAAGLPAGTRFANKTGAVSGIRCDAGIIFAPTGPIVICVLTGKNTDRSWSATNSANKLCGSIGRVVFEYFNPPHKREAAPRGEPLAQGAFGETVEMLQRTLNARMEPSPMLSVDGDFGPGTEGAVRAFQESKNLPATGVVDQATWTALGALVSEQPQPDPAVVNSVKLPVEPADSLDGAPFVTCRGFAITDAMTGELLLGHAADVPMEPASTTKIMTAWLVVKQAQENPAVLDEVLTFSPRADKMRGSTSGLRAGEKISVREALFGLMLPSGNDMSVAFAEHFGHRLADSDSGDDPLPLFVEAMNVEARRLGMKNTVFRNPHGWPDVEHVTTAFDLTRLASVAFRDEVFRKCVATRRHGVQVTGPGGYTRNVVWENSNMLLGIAGYDGVKTGTTTRAGACLVSTAKRGNRRLFVCVLGSASTDSRYADTRNLYRWAWNTLAD